MTHKNNIKDLEKLSFKIEEMGGSEKLKVRKKAGYLNARERIDLFFDKGTFFEIGKFVTSSNIHDKDKTPADGKITGYGKVSNRRVAAISNDLTVKGASSSEMNTKKISFIKKSAEKLGLPIVFFGESSGARMPDIMGAKGMSQAGQDNTQYIRTRKVPWVSAILGPCYGSSAWYSVLSDFVVMRRGSVLAVSSPKVLSLATNETIDPEELGGWEMHSQITGIADRVVDTDHEAISLMQSFLSYLPSNNNEIPPQKKVTEDSLKKIDEILSVIPENPKRTYDMREVINLIADEDTAFPMKHDFAKSAVTELARLNGKTVGFIGSNPKFNGGAMDPNACDKITSFLVFCDSFNIPIIILVDTPGFLIGVEGEKQKAPGKIMNFMTALQLCSVPKISVILRKSYGQAYLNMGGGSNSDLVIAWPFAEVSFISPELGVWVVNNKKIQDNDPNYNNYLKKMTYDNSALELARSFGIQDIIDPRNTRQYLINALETLDKKIAKHNMSNWPTTF